MPNRLPTSPDTLGPNQLLMPIAVEKFVAMAGPEFAPIVEFNCRLCGGILRLNADWVEFLWRRLQSDLEMPGRIAACGGPQEAQRVCIEYWETAFAQYQEEVAKVGETFLKLTASSVQDQSKAISRERQIAA